MSKICAKCKFYEKKHCKLHDTATCGAATCKKYRESDAAKADRAAQQSQRKKPVPRGGSCKNCRWLAVVDGRHHCNAHDVRTLKTCGCNSRYEPKPKEPAA